MATGKVALQFITRKRTRARRFIKNTQAPVCCDAHVIHVCCVCCWLALPDVRLCPMRRVLERPSKKVEPGAVMHDRVYAIGDYLCAKIAHERRHHVRIRLNYPQIRKMESIRVFLQAKLYSRASQSSNNRRTISRDFLNT